MSNALKIEMPVRLAQIDARLLAKVSALVSEITGVQLGERQQGMVEGRLRKRLLDLGMERGEDYLDYLAKHREEETQILVGLLTTHHTYFFREFSHFEYLETEGLVGLVAAARAQGRRSLRVWSAAASTGQESYSLAMFLRFHLRTIAPDFKFEILGTDVDPRSIRTAQNGVYHRKEIKDAPLQYLAGNWIRGTGDIADFVKAKGEIKDACHFQVGNLLELGSMPSDGLFDIIFCRNVFIYFETEQVQKITRALLERLTPEGRLFLGISESVRGSEIKVQTLGPSIYGHPPTGVKTPVTRATPAPKPTLAPAAAVARPIRVLCVDDSPSVLTLLKQILKKENGYEVVGTAGNGVEAAEKVKALAPDVLTLDIHMPEMDGLAYLKRHVGANHPPVIMVSSVSREDADLAVQCLNHGASDYVEKPALANLAQRGEELRAKLGSAFRNRARTRGPADLALEKSFANRTTIAQPETKLRIILANLSDRKRTIDFLNEQPTPRPPTLLLFEGAGSALPSIAKSLEGKMAGSRVQFQEKPFDKKDVAVDRVTIADFTLIESARSIFETYTTSILVFGEMSKSASFKLAAWKASQILVEDLGAGSPLSDAKADRVPATSFAYMSNEFLGKKNGRD